VSKNCATKAKFSAFARLFASSSQTFLSDSRFVGSCPSHGSPRIYYCRFKLITASIALISLNSNKTTRIDWKRRKLATFYRIWSLRLRFATSKFEDCSFRFVPFFRSIDAVLLTRRSYRPRWYHCETEARSQVPHQRTRLGVPRP